MSATAMIVFWLLALVVSLFHGFSFGVVFGISTSDKGWAWKLHQFWLNFLGSAVGWVALWFLVKGLFDCAISQSCALQYGWAEIGLFFLAFLGITGYVPFTVIGLASGIKELAAKVEGLAK